VPTYSVFVRAVARLTEEPLASVHARFSTAASDGAPGRDAQGRFIRHATKETVQAIARYDPAVAAMMATIRAEDAN